MLRYTLDRLLFAVPLLIGLSVLAFVYVRVIPGDPVAAALGVFADPEFVAELRAKYGLDRPLVEQYVVWVQNLLAGDLGVSIGSQQPIAPILISRVPATLQLMLGGFIVTTLISVPAGVIAGSRPKSIVGRVISGLSLAGLAIPGFWLAVLLILVVAVQFKILPPLGYVAFTEDPLGSIRFTLLPALVIGLGSAPFMARYTRTTVIEVMKEPFIPYADARGLRERVIFYRYVLRNALPNLVVVLGLLVGGLLAGSIVIEQIFAWPGTGRLIIGAVLERDYNMIQSTVLVYGVIFIVINLFVELLQAALDPRIRLR